RNLVLLTHVSDGVVDDAAMVRVVEALLDQALRDGNGEIRYLAAEILAGTANVLIELLPRARHEARGLGLRRVREAALLVRCFLEGLGADALRLGVGGLDLRGELVALLLGLRPRFLCLVKRALDRPRSLVHLGHQRFVEEPGQENEEDR